MFDTCMVTRNTAGEGGGEARAGQARRPARGVAGGMAGAGRYGPGWSGSWSRHCCCCSATARRTATTSPTRSAGLVPDERIDLGNLYRLLRALEAEGLVRSRWRDDLPGRSKRTYELTADGREVLDAWAAALDQLHTNLAAFRRRYQEGGA